MNGTTKKLVMASMFAALCCVTTMIIKIPSPLKGYLNLGDCVVLLAGFMLPPLYAFLAAGIGSALAEHLMEACLGRLGVLPCFEFLLSCESVGAGKNSPAVFLEAAKRLGAEPHEIAVFEDALYAIKTAKQAGFYVVAVSDEAADRNAVKAAADEFISWEEQL